MISEVCAELRNYFLRDYINPEHYIHYGSFVIANGEMQSLPFLKENQYYRIVGSTFNDGVYQYHDPERSRESGTMTSEEFDGAIWEMFVPPDFIALVSEIQQWTANNANVINSPYQSESFGGYSYSLKGGNDADKSSAGTWQSQFASRLKPYRRISVL